jgi:hypothetical protein
MARPRHTNVHVAYAHKHTLALSIVIAITSGAVLRSFP